jgi:hypothetical protein
MVTDDGETAVYNLITTVGPRAYPCSTSSRAVLNLGVAFRRRLETQHGRGLGTGLLGIISTLLMMEHTPWIYRAHK